MGGRRGREGLGGVFFGVWCFFCVFVGCGFMVWVWRCVLGCVCLFLGRKGGGGEG